MAAPCPHRRSRAAPHLLPDLRAHARPGLRGARPTPITTLVLDGRIATETRLPSERELAGGAAASAGPRSPPPTTRCAATASSPAGPASGSFVTVPAGSEPRPSLARWTHAGQRAPADVIDLSCAALPAPPDAAAGRRARAAARPRRVLPRRRLRAGRAAGAARGVADPVHRARRADPARADPGHQRRAARPRPAAAPAGRPGRPGAHRAADLPRRARRDPGQRRAHRPGADGRRTAAGRSASCRPRCARRSRGWPT